jgi:hypothetical protein
VTRVDVTFSAPVLQLNFFFSGRIHYDHCPRGKAQRVALRPSSARQAAAAASVASHAAGASKRLRLPARVRSSGSGGTHVCARMERPLWPSRMQHRSAAPCGGDKPTMMATRVLRSMGLNLVRLKLVYLRG